MVIIFVNNDAFSKKDLWTDGIHLLESSETTTEKNSISRFSCFQSFQTAGEEKDFAYSENRCNKKLGSQRFPNENDSREKKSDRSINDTSLDPLSKRKNLRLKNVNKVVIGIINMNSLLLII